MNFVIVKFNLIQSAYVKYWNITYEAFIKIKTKAVSVLDFMEYKSNVIIFNEARLQHNSHAFALLEKRAVRVINNTDFLDHSSPSFKQSNILKIEYIYKMTCWLLISKTNAIISEQI